MLLVFFFNLLIIFDKHCFCLWVPMFSSQEGPISSSNLISSCHIAKHLAQIPLRWPLLYLANAYLLEMQTGLFWKYGKMLDSPVLWTAYSNGIRGQNFHPLISLKKHFYQFCSPCDGFPHGKRAKSSSLSGATTHVNWNSCHQELKLLPCFVSPSWWDLLLGRCLPTPQHSEASIHYSIITAWMPIQIMVILTCRKCKCIIHMLVLQRGLNSSCKQLSFSPAF